MTTPSQAEIVANADALVTALNAGTWTIPFEARREYIEILNLEEDFDELRVAVVPASLEEELAGRPRVSEDFVLRIVMQMQAKPEDRPLLDQLMLVCQEIRDSIREADIGDAVWVKTEVPLLFDSTMLMQSNSFLCIIHATFRDVR